MLVRIGLACAFIVLLFSGCDWFSQVRQQDKEIERATRAIETAQTDAERAEAYAARGAAIGEKARYSRAFKLVPGDEYARLLELSLKDHGQAIALAPANAGMYYREGQTWFMQAAFATSDPARDPMPREYYESAKVKLTRAIELDPRHAGAWEVRGMSNEGTGDLDSAIADYTQLAALQPKMRYRLADAYCNRGYAKLRMKNHVDRAIDDYERSVEIGSAADGCSCEPYNPLVGIYLNEKRDVEKARAVVRQALASGKWIAPEYLDRLK